MKVFANGFNLYGQLIKPTSLLEKLDVVFESEVIKNFEIHHSYSYFVTQDSFLIFSDVNKSIELDITKIIKVASNDERILVLDNDGSLMKFDCNENFNVSNVPNLLNIEELSDKLTDVSCGSKIAVFYSKEAKLFTMANPLKFAKKNLIQIQCGREHCLLLDDEGNVYSFGRGSRGQLGHGTLEDESEPVLIEALAGLKINTIRAGGWHSCALSADGDLYTWGWNGNGQLGLENSTKDKPVTVQATPQIVESFSTEMNVKMVALGNRHTLAMLDNKQLFGCGWNKYKQLNSNTEEEYYSFEHIHDFSREDVLEVKAGPWNSAILCR